MNGNDHYSGINMLLNSATVFFFLVRRLIITNEEGERLFPLSYLSGKRREELFYELEVIPYEREREGVIFIDTLSLREVEPGAYSVIEFKL